MTSLQSNKTRVRKRVRKERQDNGIQPGNIALSLAGHPYKQHDQDADRRGNQEYFAFDGFNGIEDEFFAR